jgi:hypothetical protein
MNELLEEDISMNGGGDDANEGGGKHDAKFDRNILLASVDEDESIRIEQDEEREVNDFLRELERDTKTIPVGMRYSPGQLEATKKEWISGFFLQAAEEITSSQKPLSKTEFLSRYSVHNVSPRPRQRAKQPESRKITRGVLEKILLEIADTLVSEETTALIFLEADTEGAGFVHVDDVANYINSIEPRTQKERQDYIFRSMLLSFSLWCWVFFFLGCIASISMDFSGRKFGGLYGDPGIIPWLFQIGTVGFLFLNYDFEKIEFERLQSINQKLVRWIRRGRY